MRKASTRFRPGLLNHRAYSGRKGKTVAPAGSDITAEQRFFAVNEPVIGLLIDMTERSGNTHKQAGLQSPDIVQIKRKLVAQLWIQSLLKKGTCDTA